MPNYSSWPLKPSNVDWWVVVVWERIRSDSYISYRQVTQANVGDSAGLTKDVWQTQCGKETWCRSQVLYIYIQSASVRSHCFSFTLRMKKINENLMLLCWVASFARLDSCRFYFYFIYIYCRIFCSAPTTAEHRNMEFGKSLFGERLTPSSMYVWLPLIDDTSSVVHTPFMYPIRSTLIKTNSNLIMPSSACKTLHGCVLFVCDSFGCRLMQ